MGVIGFAGKLPVAVVLQWKGENIPNAVTTSTKDFRYVIANESVTKITITGSLGGAKTLIRREAAKGMRLYDDKLNTFITTPVSGAALDKLLDPVAKPTFAIELTFAFHTFFDVLLQQMTRTDADLHNLANPNDSKAILDTFVHEGTSGKVTITYKSATQTIKSLPCRLVDKDVKPAGKGKPPAVKLVFELDFLPGIDPTRREAMRKLIAMDWSKLARFGKSLNPLPDFLVVWWQNVIAYLSNYSDLSRGEKFRTAIVGRHKGKTPKELSLDLRDDIDLHLITANHWGQAREDLKAEHHQRLLSDLFGTLHQSAWLSSPVNFLRSLQDRFSLSQNQGAALSLQYGAGHCGEHAAASFSILKDIIGDPGTKVSHAIQTGNANIDHAFVVYNLDADTVFSTVTTNSNNSRTDGAGKPISVWNLRDTMTKNGLKEGFIMDPYLDKSVMKPTAKELLAALNNASRKKTGKDTDFLAFDGEFPAAFATVDLTGKSQAERKKLVKNV